MKKIIHLSDLHFGTQRPGILNALAEQVLRISPDIVVISGDLTQRALTSQFEAAKLFLSTLSSQNILCVPGNHDISLHNVMERFLYPFDKYKKYIHNNLQPEYVWENVAILGINSATPFKHMNGHITENQLNEVTEFFQKNSQATIRMVIMHHNLIHSVRHKIINNAEKIINTFAAAKVNLVLAGHIHSAQVELLKRDYLSHNMYIVTAGTAISTRTIEPNSFNIITLNENECECELTVKEYKNEAFEIAKQQMLHF